jgi:hypothetical protein
MHITTVGRGGRGSWSRVTRGLMSLVLLGSAVAVAVMTVGSPAVADAAGLPAVVVPGNFAGDAGTDLAFVGGRLGRTPLAVSNGDGSFAVRSLPLPVPDFAGWSQLPGVHVLNGDFNHDGRTDIALLPPPGNPWWNTIPVAMNDGNGGFTVTNTPSPDFAGWVQVPGSQVVTGDFNHDGNTDIALAGAPGWTTIPVAFSNGDGTFTVTNASRPDFAGWAYTPYGARLWAGDFNHDGRTDLALTGAGYFTTIPVALSNGDGTFAITNGSSPDFANWAKGSGVQVVTGDFNHDGNTDFALAGAGGWVTIPVAFSNGDGSFTVTNSANPDFAGWAYSPYGARLWAGDFNHDGRTDLALTGAGFFTTIPVAFSNGDGSFATTNTSSPEFAGWARVPGVQVVIGDFNHDSFADIGLAGGAGWISVPVAFSTGDGNFNVTNNLNPQLGALLQSLSDRRHDNGYGIALQAPDGHLRYIDPNGLARQSASVLAAGTSPSIGEQPEAGFTSAFVASDNTFWVGNPMSGDRQVTTQFTVRPGTSPSILGSDNGNNRWMATVQDAAGRVWTYDSVGHLAQLPSMVAAAATSPSIAALADGSFEETFVDASTGLVWVANSDPNDPYYTHVLGSGLAIAPGTDPAIASMYGTIEWTVAFQGNDHHLWTVDQRGNQVQTPYVLDPTTGVAVTHLASGGYEVVFEQSDGRLYKMGPDGVASLAGSGLGMAAHTRPAIALGARGYGVVFHARDSDTVWFVDPNNLGLDTGQHIAANTSPAVALTTDTSPTAPGISALHVSGNNVTVTWQDRSNNERGFEVERLTAPGEWHDIHRQATDDVDGTGETYVYTDTDTSVPISPRCYRVLSFNNAMPAASQEQCNLPSLNIPSTVPSDVQMWHGLSSTQDGTGTLATFNPLAGKDQSLAHAGQVFGVNLGFQDAPAVWTVEAFADTAHLSKGQLVALNVAQGGWVKRQDQNFSIDLGFDSHPSYEWVVLSSTQGGPLAQGNFALWNINRGDFLVFCDSTASVDLCWRSQVHDPLPTPDPGPVVQPAAAQSGVGLLRVFNCAAAGHPVSLWVKDSTGGGFQKVGGLALQSNAETGCVAKDSQPLLFTPVAQHSIQVVATDPLRTGCTTDDPSNAACVVESRTIVGNPAGAIETTVVGVGTERSPFAYNALNG